MPTIADCPCPGDFISVGLRSTFSKRSISGTAPNYRYIKARSNEGNLYILRFDEHHPAWELIMFKSVRKDRA